MKRTIRYTRAINQTGESNNETVKRILVCLGQKSNDAICEFIESIAIEHYVDALLQAQAAQPQEQQHQTSKAIKVEIMSQVQQQQQHKKSYPIYNFLQF